MCVYIYTHVQLPNMHMQSHAYIYIYIYMSMNTTDLSYNGLYSPYPPNKSFPIMVCRLVDLLPRPAERNLLSRCSCQVRINPRNQQLHASSQDDSMSPQVPCFGLEMLLSMVSALAYFGSLSLTSVHFWGGARNQKESVSKGHLAGSPRHRKSEVANHPEPRGSACASEPQMRRNVQHRAVHTAPAKQQTAEGQRSSPLLRLIPKRGSPIVHQAKATRVSQINL